MDNLFHEQEKGLQPGKAVSGGLPRLASEKQAQGCPSCDPPLPRRILESKQPCFCEKQSELSQGMQAAQKPCPKTPLQQSELSQYEAIAFVGESLGPFFLQDPRLGTGHASFEALSSLDAHSAACEWPFVPYDKAYRWLHAMVLGLEQGIDEDGLVWEFRRLFVGPAPKPAPPWGSVYTDRECVIFGESTLDLRSWMRTRGIARLGGTEEPEDHIGLLLILMAWLARHKPLLLDEFLRLHLLTWSSHFLAQLGEAAKHPFYVGLAYLTKASLEGIMSARAVRVIYPRFYR